MITGRFSLLGGGSLVSALEGRRRVGKRVCYRCWGACEKPRGWFPLVSAAQDLCKSLNTGVQFFEGKTEDGMENKDGVFWNKLLHLHSGSEIGGRVLNISM